MFPLLSPYLQGVLCGRLRRSLSAPVTANPRDSVVENSVEAVMDLERRPGTRGVGLAPTRPRIRTE